MKEKYDTKQNVRALPDVTTYNLVMSAYFKHDRDAYEKVKSLVQEMTDNGPKPNIVSYNYLLKTILVNVDSIHNAGHEANEILKSMHFLHDTNQNNTIQPDVINYSSVMNIHIHQQRYEKQKDAEAGDKCYRLLQEMKHFYNKDNIYYKKLQPNIKIYTIVMKAYYYQSNLMNQDNTKKVIDLLLEAENDFLAHNNKKAKPDLYSFGLVLDVIHNNINGADNVNVLQMIQHVYDCMNRLNLSPTKEIVKKFIDIIDERREDDTFYNNALGIIEELTDGIKSDKCK